MYPRHQRVARGKKHGGELVKYQIHVRTQHSNGSSAHRFGGPDVYVAVTAAPDGAIVPRCLNQKVLKSRGIRIFYCGEGYSKNSGPRSALGKAMDRARRIIETMESSMGQDGGAAA
jgi:hypothetical protein